MESMAAAFGSTILRCPSLASIFLCEQLPFRRDPFFSPRGRAGSGLMDTAIIHIVDDDEQTRVAMRRLLTAEGLEARVYASASEFLDRFTPDSPGCIILDVRLPGLSGLDLQARLAKREDSLP